MSFDPPLAVVIQHEEHEGPGLLRPALEGAGFQLALRHREVRDEDVRAPLVLVMGGPMGVYEASRYPFLLDELRLLRARLEARRPSLGICLGAQLLAAAAGARVYPGTHGWELGVMPISLTPDGRKDLAFAPLPASLDVAQWHEDTFDPVPGATLLASTERYPQQAFRIGSSYGLQFHPELTPEHLGSWLRAAPGDVKEAGRDVEAVEREDLPGLSAAQPAVRGLLDRLARHCAAACRERS